MRGGWSQALQYLHINLHPSDILEFAWPHELFYAFPHWPWYPLTRVREPNHKLILIALQWPVCTNLWQQSYPHLWSNYSCGRGLKVALSDHSHAPSVSISQNTSSSATWSLSNSKWEVLCLEHSGPHWHSEKSQCSFRFTPALAATSRSRHDVGFRESQHASDATTSHPTSKRGALNSPEVFCPPLLEERALRLCAQASSCSVFA